MNCQNYSVKLRGWRTKFTVETFRGFGIYAQYENDKPAGKFDVILKPFFVDNISILSYGCIS